MPGCFAHLDLHPNAIELARRRVAAGAGYIDLTSSNPTWQSLLFPPEILHAASATYWATRRYAPDPRGNPAARAAIADYYAQRVPPLALPSDAIFITASTSEAYLLLFSLLADPGDNLLAPNVTYPCSSTCRTTPARTADLRTGRGARLADRWCEFAGASDSRSRAVLIVSPHNPTGAIIQAPLPALSTLGLPLICDEVFAPFTYRAAHTPPVGALHPDLPVFMLNGISKLFALPDLKLGWIALNTAAEVGYSERLELLNDTLLGAK